MVMSENDAKRRYREGIEEIGIDAYRRAAQENTVTGAAQILEDAKTENFDSGTFADRYAQNY